MTANDYVFLVAGLLILGLMLVVSKVVRAILWETLRHPFRLSHIEVRQGQVVITHTQASATTDAESQSPAGAH
jgi:Na+/serine symporter